MDSAKFAGIVALGTAIGLAVALPEAERVNMGAAAFVTVCLNAGFAAWWYATGRSFIRLIRQAKAGR